MRKAVTDGGAAKRAPGKECISAAYRILGYEVELAAEFWRLLAEEREPELLQLILGKWVPRGIPPKPLKNA